MEILNFEEKSFIRTVFGPYASTAAPDMYDDAVIIDLAELTGRPDADLVVYSVDQPSFIRHADPDLDPYRFYGRWVAGTTCNDILAMGARCRGFSLALSAPHSAQVGDIESLLKGITDVLSRIGATYEGGNLHNGALSTVGFAWGVVARDRVVRRSGARPGDLIAVTGPLGLGWLEYQLRTHGLTDRIAADDRAAFLAYKAMPVGAAAAIGEAASRGWLTSGMDLSDGLVEFLYTIRQRSGCGCLIDASRLPVSGAAMRNLPLLAEILDAESRAALSREPALVALEAGYDSALRHAFTVPAEVAGEAQQLFAAHDAELVVIGEVTSGHDVLLRQGASDTEIPEFWDDKLRQEDVLDAWAAFLKAFA